MARALSKTVKIGSFDDLPIMLTIKNVKNYNLTVKKDSIHISVPPGTEAEKIDELIESWTPFIAEKVAVNKELEKLEGVFLTDLDDYKVYYSVKKNIREIKIVRGEKKGEVLVLIPNNLYYQFSDRESFERFLKKEVKDKRDYFLATSMYLEGDYENLVIKKVLIHAEEYPVKFIPNLDSVRLTGNKLCLPDSLRDNLEEQLIALDDFLINRLLEFSRTSLIKWEKITGNTVREMQIKKYKSKWASIKISNGILRLNFYLICVPKDCIESTILHELCHLDHPDHQADFYEELLYYMPKYYFYDSKLKHYDLPIEYFELGFEDK